MKLNGEVGRNDGEESREHVSNKDQIAHLLHSKGVEDLRCTIELNVKVYELPFEPDHDQIFVQEGGDGIASNDCQVTGNYVRSQERGEEARGCPLVQKYDDSQSAQLIF